MTAAAPGSRRKRQHAFCIPSCFFSSSSVYYDEDAPRQAYLWTRLSGQSKTVPFDEIAVVDGGEGEDAARNGTQRPWLLEKHRKVKLQKRNTTISKPFTFSTLSLNRSDNQQSSINHHSYKHKSFHQQTTAIQQHDKAQTGARTSHFGLTGLIMMGTMMAAMLFYGRIFAIFGTCLCFYILSFLRSLQPLPPQAGRA